MQLTVDQVLAAVPALDAIIVARRPMPQRAKYQLARMRAKLQPEYEAAAPQRDELVLRHGDRRDDGQTQVMLAHMAEFREEWDQIGSMVVDIDIQPLRLSDLSVALLGAETYENGPIEAAELLALGDLVIE